MPEISIIIRSKNEERWIGHCLSMLNQQDLRDFEVILVDNGSTDHTLRVAQRFPVAAIVNVEKFRPGFALNEGIRASTGRFLVCLSAHCIPKQTDWLSSLRRNFDGDERVAGVYGRQLPLSFTDPLEKRDLLLVFGQDRRVQIKDYFFHNANSMLRRDVWEQFPFDEGVTNMEDRVWGKAVIQAGYQLVYEPDAAVYHHHGLHQGNAPERAKGVVAIIERVDDDVFNDLPRSMRPEQANVAAVVPVQNNPARGSTEYELLARTVATLHAAKYVSSVHVLSSDRRLAEDLKAAHLDRNLIPDANALGLGDLMREALALIESQASYPDAVLYVNYDYVSRPEGLFDELVRDAQYKGYETVFPGYVDYGHFWLRDGDRGYHETDASLKGRAERQPVYRALYGLGCLTASSVVRSGKLVGGRVGILAVDEFKYIVRVRDLDGAPAPQTNR